MSWIRRAIQAAAAANASANANASPSPARDQDALDAAHSHFPVPPPLRVVASDRADLSSATPQGPSSAQAPAEQTAAAAAEARQASLAQTAGVTLPLQAVAVLPSPGANVRQSVPATTGQLPAGERPATAPATGPTPSAAAGPTPGPTTPSIQFHFTGDLADTLVLQFTVVENGIGAELVALIGAHMFTFGAMGFAEHILNSLFEGQLGAGAEGRGPAPASAAQVDAIPKVKVDVAGHKRAENTADGPSCVVCCEDFEQDGEALQFPQCHHVYHDACLREWLHQSQSCPICRTPLPQTDAPAENPDPEPEEAPRPTLTVPEEQPETGSEQPAVEQPTEQDQGSLRPVSAIASALFDNLLSGRRRPREASDGSSHEDDPGPARQRSRVVSSGVPEENVSPRAPTDTTENTVRPSRGQSIGAAIRLPNYFLRR